MERDGRALTIQTNDAQRSALCAVSGIANQTFNASVAIDTVAQMIALSRVQMRKTRIVLDLTAYALLWMQFSAHLLGALRTNTRAAGGST